MILKVEHLQKVINGRQILSDVSFEADKSDVLALIGPNGAGKTTTIRCIVNAINKDGGDIFFKGEPIKCHHKKEIAVVSEDRYVFHNLTGEDYLALWKNVYPLFDEHLFRNFVANYQFNLKQKVETYSIGMKTLFLFILAISSGAELLLLDEPTQHLDPTIRSDVIKLISYCAKNEKTVIVSSHEIFELEEYITRFALIKNGRIVYTDGVDEAKTKHRVISKGEKFDNAEVVGLIFDDILIKTDDDCGRYPKLNDIVVAYLKSRTALEM